MPEFALHVSRCISSFVITTMFTTNTNPTALPRYEVQPGPSIPLRALFRSRESPRESLRPSQDHPRSTAATLGERIEEDILHGNYECSVCMNSVRNRSPVWSCRSCWCVFHFACIRHWSTERPSRYFTCPSCREDYPKPPRFSCWCGRYSGAEYLNCPGERTLIDNSCGDHCPHLAPCGQSCQRKCHAGPCLPCNAGNRCRHVRPTGSALPSDIPLRGVRTVRPRPALPSLLERYVGPLRCQRGNYRT